MLYNEIKLSTGQNLRYVGKGFPGFVKGQPYMTFISHHNAYQYLAKYNDVSIIVNKRYAIAF